MLSAESFCDYLGVDYETKGGVTRIICPFHDDTHPSLVIYPELERGSWCFACGQGASWAWLATQIKGITYAQALADLGQEVLPASEVRHIIKPPTALSFCDEPNEKFVQAFEEKYAKCLPIDGWGAAEVWLENKKLLDTAKKLGWKWHKKGVFRHWNDGLVIPYHINGKIAYVRFRGFEANYVKFEKPKGPMDVGIQPYYDTFRPCDTVFIVEGESDAASVYAHGCSAIGIPGACSKKAINSVMAFVADHSYIKRVILCGDKDEAGQNMNRLCREAMITMGVRADTIVYTVESEGDKCDLNDDHINGKFRPPVEWTCNHCNNYNRCFPQETDFSAFVDRMDTYLGKCEEKGYNPWEKYGNIEVLPVVEKMLKK